MTTSACPNRQDLLSFALGQLPESQIEWVTDHLEACDGCEATVADLDGNSDTFIDGLQSPPGASEFADEAAFERMLNEVRSIGREPNSVADEGLRHELGTIGEYQLLGELSRGGMATVYRAVHTRMQRAVAIKVLPVHRGDNRQLLSRFHREIEAIAKLDHPNLVQAYEAGEANGVNYLVMELVDGVDLHRLVKQLGPLPVADACEISRQIAAGLEHVREHGLVHRDIKPSNVLLARDGQVKVADLGLALWESSATQQDLTTTGQIMGTLDYMAPEQADNSHQVDARADIYSLGCTLFKLLTSRAPFADPHCESPVKKLLAHATSTAPFTRDLRPDVPHDVATLIASMLAKDPAQRPQRADEIMQRLERHTSEADLAALAARVDVDCQISDHAAEDDARTFLKRTPDGKIREEADAALERGSRSWLWSWPALGLLVIVLAAIVVVVKTPHGDLIISSPEGDVQIEVSQGGKVVAVVDTATKESIKLRVGEYGLKLIDENKRLELQFEEFTLRRDQQVVVNVRLESVADDAPKENPTPERPSPRATETARVSPPHWSKVISRKTVYLETAAATQDLMQSFANKEPLRRGGYKIVRRRATELAMLLGIVAQYDKEGAFRWSRDEAAMGRDNWATLAREKEMQGGGLLELLKAMSDIQEKLKQPGDLDNDAHKSNDVVTDWAKVCDRVPLMETLNELYIEELTPRTSDQKEFAVANERVKQHAEIMAAIATVLYQPSMPESDDKDYRDFAKSLMEHSRRLAAAGEQGDFTEAKHHMRMISNACSQCHEMYR